MRKKKPVEFEVADAKELKLVCIAYEAIQKIRILTANKIDGTADAYHIPKKRVAKLHELFDVKLKEQEKSLIPLLNSYGSIHPVWVEWLSHVKGIGPVLWASMLSIIQDINRFPTISKMYAYFGLSSMYYKCECAEGHKHLMMHDPIDRKDLCNVLKDDKGHKCNAKFTNVEKVEHKAPHRTAGYIVHWNPTAKTLAWKTANTLFMCGGKYKTQIFDHYKEKIAASNKDMPKMHIHNRALRKLAKIFLSHLWTKWRELEGLPADKPYSVAYKGEEYIAPIIDD